MVSLIAGLVVMAVTVAAFIAMMPRHGKMHRFVGTELEAYVGVAFCSAVALGFTLILSGAINLAGGVQ